MSEYCAVAIAPEGFLVPKDYKLQATGAAKITAGSFAI
jgi:hypothetical protein